MNKSESKYFNTALKMDQAFLALLEKKDFAYITVKEICEAAGVNRSTFYLHYETVGDLLQESAEYIVAHFLSHVKISAPDFVARISDCPLEELYLVTPEYLLPYLNYIRDNRRLFKTALENAAPLHMEKNYVQLFEHVFIPILNRFGVPKENRGYMMAFYIQGLMAVIREWLAHDCADSALHIAEIMQQCVMPARRI